MASELVETYGDGDAVTGGRAPTATPNALDGIRSETGEGGTGAEAAAARKADATSTGKAGVGAGADGKGRKSAPYG